MKSPTDIEVVRAMSRCGKDFIARLAADGIFYAEPDDLPKIKRLYPDEWRRYREIAAQELKTKESKP